MDGGPCLTEQPFCELCEPLPVRPPSVVPVSTLRDSPRPVEHPDGVVYRLQPLGVECLRDEVDDTLVVVLEVVRAVVVGNRAAPAGCRPPAHPPGLLQNGYTRVGRVVDDVSRCTGGRTRADDTDIHAPTLGRGH